MADKNDNGNVPSELSSDTVIEPFSPQDRDTIPSNILQFENLISGFSTTLLDAPAETLENELETWLKKFVEFLEVDRSVVNEYLDDDKTIRILLDYTVPEVDAPPLQYEYQPSEGLIKELKKGTTVKAERIPDDLPETLHGEIIHGTNTKSIMVVPLSIGNKIIGNLSFASYRKERKWPDDLVRRIKLIGEIIANAILRIRSHETLIDEKEHRHMLEERYSSIIKTANVGFMITDLNAQILDVNDNYCEMSGYSREELLGMAIYQLDVSHDPDNLDKEKNQLLQEGSYHQEHSHKKKDGTIIDVLVSANLLETEGFICSFIRDITELNQSRREREERLKFEELISEFSATLISINLDDINEELNHGIRRFVDLLKVDRCIINEYQDDKNTVKPLITHTVSDVDIQPPEESLSIPDKIKSQFERGIIIRADKIPEDLPPQFRGWMIEDHNTKSLVIVPLTAGNQILGNLTFASYRNERKWSDELVSRMKLIGEIVANAILRIRSHEALIEEMEHRHMLEEKYATVLETANVGFWISDFDSNIIDVNDEYCRMSGYNRDEVLSMKITDIQIPLPPQELTRISKEVESTGATHHEVAHKKKDGSLMDLDVSSTVLGDNIFFSFMRDITELNQIRREQDERLKFEKFVSEFSAALINLNPDNIINELGNWLEDFVYLLGVDRFIVNEYVNDQKNVQILMHYTVPEVNIPIVNMRQIPEGVVEELEKGVLRAEKIPEDLPQVFQGTHVEKHNTKSFVVVPLLTGNRVFGTLVFCSYRKERQWPDDLVRRIKLIGEIVANAILRLRSYQSLIEEMDRRQMLEERYSSIIKNANVGFWIINFPELSIDEVNDEYCHMSGYSRDEIISKKVWEIDASLDPNEVGKLAEILNKEGALQHVASHIRNDGSLFDVAISSKLLRREGIVCSFMRDITDINQARKELEERLEFEELVSGFSAALMQIKLDNARNELSRWLERFAVHMNVDRCVISQYEDNFTKHQFICTYTKPEIESDIGFFPDKPIPTFGYHTYLKRGEILKFDNPSDSFPEDLKAGMIDQIKHGTKSMVMFPLHAGDVLLGSMSFATVITEKKWSQDLIRRLKLLAEIFANALMRERTDFELENHRRDLEELVDERTASLREAQQELVLSEKMATLGRLTATVSHELRNPLGTIRSSLFAVNRRLKGQDKKTQKALERAERSIERCDIIIEELLNYSKTQPLMLMPTDIDNWLTELLEEEKPPEDIVLEKELNSDVSIEVDRERLRRCMINILTNAYQSIEEKADDSNPGYVKVITKKDESGMKIEISDNGVGFTQEDMNRIYEPLYSTKTFGVGLGMPITKQIVEMHGWNMDMKGEPGKGALVTISIPIS